MHDNKSDAREANSRWLLMVRDHAWPT